MFLFGPPNIEKMKALRDVQGLIKALGYEKEAVRQNAVNALIEIGIPASDALIGALKSPIPMVRQGAILALGKIGDIRAVKPLMEIVRDKYEKPQVRCAAVEALRIIGDTSATDALIEALGDPWLKQAAEQALIEMRDKEAVPKLLKALKTAGMSVAPYARILGAFQARRAVKPLIAVLTNPYTRIDAEARRAIADALSAIGAPAVESLIPLLDAFETDYREVAIVALGNIEDPRAAKALIARWNKEANPALKMEIAERLGNYDDPRIVEYLVKELQENLRFPRKTAWARKIVAQALVKIYQRAKIPANARSRILALRSAITQYHSDFHQDRSFPDYSHLDKHSDNGGIGVDFPL